MSEEKKNIKKSALLAKWKSMKKKAAPSIPLRKEGDILLPSHGQRRLWLLQQLYPDSPLYQYGHYYSIKGKLDIVALENALQALVQRHEILRSNFRSTEEGLIVTVQEEPIIGIQEHDGDNIKDLKSFAKGLALRPFDLEKDILFRVDCISFSEEEHVLVLSIHHIIGDRESLLILNREWFDNYQSIVKGQEPNTAKLPLQYADYALWQKGKETPAEQLKYWTDKLTGELPLLALPQDFTRPKQPDFSGETIFTSLSPSLTQQLTDLASHCKTTLNVVLLAAFKCLLFRYSGQNDILVGSPFGNRDKTELESLIGFFNETLVLKSTINPDDSFKDLIEKLRADSLEALSHKNVPFDELVNALKADRAGGANPVFQAMFVFNGAANSPFGNTGLTITDEPLELGISKFDLTLFANKKQEDIELALEFSKELFKEETARRILDHLAVMIDSLCQNAEGKIGLAEILSPEEKTMMLETWNQTDIPVSPFDSIHQIITEKAKENPSGIAVRVAEKSLTYQELHKQSDALAYALQQQGVEANDAIGLYTPRSIEMLVGILGILKSGAAYLPLDPEYPQERIAFMIEDSGAKIILHNNNFTESVERNIPVLDINKCVEKNIGKSPKEIHNTENLAYYIYTSGSSGKPKGVPVRHKNLIHSTTVRFEWFKHQPSVFLLLSSFSFDSSIVGIFWTMCSGGTLVLPKTRVEQDIRSLAKIIQENKVSHTLLLPSLYQLLLEFAPKKSLASLNTVMVAGEACTSQVINAHFESIPQAELINEYGPTEGTVWCTAHKISSQDAEGSIPIGKPIPNMRNYILDQYLSPVPIGVAGELFISGKGITQGYRNRPELTTKKFIPSPFVEGEMMYKTGDLASYRTDGTIDFLGRADSQIKIRGHRVELDEIRQRILDIPGIKDAAVSLGKNQNIQAFFIAKKGIEDIPIRAILSSEIPEYMVPSSFTEMESFPTLPNGKLDYSKFPEPETTALSKERSYEAPRTETEKRLAVIWEQVLGINEISIHDRFFDIGGDSLKSIRVIAKAQDAGYDVKPHLLFRYPSIAELSEYLEKGDASEGWSALVSLNQSKGETPLFCIHSGGGHVFFYQALAKLLGDDLPLYALQPKGLENGSAFHSSIEEMAAHYIQEIKSIQPEGPYRILGTCFSNAVGLEMAHQLKDSGAEIDSLIFVDSGPAYLEGLAERGGKKTASRFAKMLKDGDWKGIQRKIRNRFIYAGRKLKAPIENEQEKNLRLTINSLNHLYNLYNWKAIDERVTFIRSTEFAGRKDKDKHITQWTKLAKGGLDVHITEGHHLTLFEEPEVQGLAEKIKACIFSKNIAE